MNSSVLIEDKKNRGYLFLHFDPTQGSDYWTITHKVHDSPNSIEEEKVYKVEISQQSGMYIVENIESEFIEKFDCLAKIRGMPFETPRSLLEKFVKVIFP